jgi:hypothetical protein
VKEGSRHQRRVIRKGNLGKESRRKKTLSPEMLEIIPQGDGPEAVNDLGDPYVPLQGQNQKAAKMHGKVISQDTGSGRNRPLREVKMSILSTGVTQITRHAVQSQLKTPYLIKVH